MRPPNPRHYVRRAVARLAEPKGRSLAGEPMAAFLADANDLIVRPAWLVWYDGAVLPQNDPAPWTKTENGAVAYACAGGVLTVTDNSDLEYVNWWIAEAGLDDAQGVWLEAWVRVTAGSAIADLGAHMAVWDGANEHILWLRETGVNLDGEADVAVDLSDWSRVALVTRDVACKALVNDVEVQAAEATGATLNKRVGFGSGFADLGQSTAEWDWVGAALNWS